MGRDVSQSSSSFMIQSNFDPNTERRARPSEEAAAEQNRKATRRAPMPVTNLTMESGGSHSGIFVLPAGLPPMSPMDFPVYRPTSLNAGIARPSEETAAAEQNRTRIRRARLPAINPTTETGGSDSGKAEFLVKFQGYGQLSLNAATLLPPPPAPELPSGPPPEMVFSSMAKLSEADVRRAFLNYAKSRPFYGWDPPKEMAVVNIIPSTLEYLLETFCERREATMAEDPYKGDMVDGPSFGLPPPPWSISCQPDSPFQDHEKTIDVPHTTSVRPCQKCGGRGYSQCFTCQGSFLVTCSSSNGLLSLQTNHSVDVVGIEQRFTSGENDRNMCRTCMGDGRIICSNCEGFGKVKNYVKLKVKYHNHKSSFLMDGAFIPKDLKGQVAAVTIFEQTLPQVWPITDYPVPRINARSQRLVERHRTAFPTEVQRYQRQTLREIPITKVNYTWKNFSSCFWVYGANRDVYTPDYPQRSCCTIL